MNLIEATNYYLAEDEESLPNENSNGKPITRDENVEDYGMNHRPPGPDSGAPLYDLTGGGDYYPDDVYSYKAVQYYGTGDNISDRESVSVIHAVHNKPNAIVTMYRAVPKIETNADKLTKLLKAMAAVQRRNINPEEYGFPTSSKFYDWAVDERDRLQALPEEPITKLTINNGDWVTVSRNYAKEHGESSLEGKYKILSKKVKAKELYTNGDSINEFGYWKA